MLISGSSVFVSRAVALRAASFAEDRTRHAFRFFFFVFWMFFPRHAGCIFVMAATPPFQGSQCLQSGELVASRSCFALWHDRLFFASRFFDGSVGHWLGNLSPSLGGLLCPSWTVTAARSGCIAQGREPVGEMQAPPSKRVAFSAFTFFLHRSKAFRVESAELYYYRCVLL